MHTVQEATGMLFDNYKLQKKCILYHVYNNYIIK